MSEFLITSIPVPPTTCTSSIFPPLVNLRLGSSLVPPVCIAANVASVGSGVGILTTALHSSFGSVVSLIVSIE